MKQNTLLSILAMLLVFALACGGGNATAEKVGEVAQSQPEAKEEPKEEAKEEPKEEAAEPEPTATPQPEPTATPQTTFNVGDIVSIGDSVLVVLGWQDVSPNDFSKPDPGNKFIAVEAIIVNQGTDSTSISSGLQMNLKDAESKQYSSDFKATIALDSPQIDGELSPGERVRGKVGFQIPETAIGLQFVFDASIFGTGKVTVNLGDAPITVEPPAEIAGEVEQQAYAVGDVIEIGTVGLTVHDVQETPGNDFSKPEEGQKFLIVDVTIENKGGEPANISTALQMALKDSSGQRYQTDFRAQIVATGDAPEGELAPGEKIRGPVGFQVPANATGLQFEFDASIFGTGKVLVNLQ